MKVLQDSVQQMNDIHPGYKQVVLTLAQGGHGQCQRRKRFPLPAQNLSNPDMNEVVRFQAGCQNNSDGIARSARNLDTI